MLSKEEDGRKDVGVERCLNRCMLTATYIHTHGLHQADDVYLRQPHASPAGMR